MTNSGVIDADYRDEVKVALANLEEELYGVEKGDRIAQLILEDIDNRELEVVALLEDTRRGDEGFGSSDSCMDQTVKGQ